VGDHLERERKQPGGHMPESATGFMGAKRVESEV
jgi:hypothetical protein